MNALKQTVAAIAVAATAIVPVSAPAIAGERGNVVMGHNPYPQHHVQRCTIDGRCFVQQDRQRVYKKRVLKRNHRNHGGDVAGAAILGIIGGALIGQALSNQNQPRYIQRPPQHTQPHYRPSVRSYNSDVFPPAPRGVQTQRGTVRYSGSLEPWSPGWYDYCDNRYRSFNPKKGTYRGYDGKDHFCVAR